jgi:ribonuclease E
MANKMIIDASHPEETRVVVLRGSRVEEFDFESANKKPLRGNIYLAKVTRVEPSLQAAFIDYGGNRHGFLAFSEIHPDYYQIPVADRQALLEEDARAHSDDDGDDSRSERRSRRHRRPRHEAESRASADERVSEPAEAESAAEDQDREPSSFEGEAFPVSPEGEVADHRQEADAGAIAATLAEEDEGDGSEPKTTIAAETAPALPIETAAPPSEEAAGDIPLSEDEATRAENHGEDDHHHDVEPVEAAGHDDDRGEVTTLDGGAEEVASRARHSREDEGEAIEQVGGDAMEELPRRPTRLRRQYKIQEVIKRRQVLLVQVVKEERGNKGAALTTYLSLAGRYSVLMPNTARGGGISRKITNSADRSRLKSIAQDLEVPEGMGVILRTAGATRTRAEVKRDFEYLLRMWETVRETTLASSAPTLVYEEGSLIKRAIRDLYNKDIDEVIVAGDDGYREAKEFMRLLMPSHAKNVQPYRDPQPVFARAGVEAQLDAMFSNQVTLKSGGYIVINQTEALVAIDVNSGRSTREHNIEDTALRTNLEAADEVARQLRLRDLAGLIVVDFIDMEEGRNNRAVERRMKDALKNDRARIQVGRISHFGLLEMSRQRIRTGVLEGSTVVCSHCMGAGVIRSTASIALHVLRVLEDALIKSSTHDMTVRTRVEVALYILNQKRSHLRELEKRFGVSILVAADDTLTGSNYHALERGEPAAGVKPEDAETRPAALPREEPDEAEARDEEDQSEAQEDETSDSSEGEGEAETAQGDEGARRDDGDSDGGRRRRRRRRRRGGSRESMEGAGASLEPTEDGGVDQPQPTDAGLSAIAEIGGDLNIRTHEISEPTGIRHGRGGNADGSRRSRNWRRGGRDRGRPRHLDETPEIGSDADAAVGTVEAPLGDLANETPGPTFSAEPVSNETEPPAAEQESAPAETTAGYERPPEHEPTAETQGESEPVASQVEEPASDPARPKRSGWWQRARASIVGE